MAAFVPSSNLKKIRGSIQRIVYSRNKYGPIMYFKKYRVYKPTAKQLIANYNIKTLARVWSHDLSDSQYEAWAEYTKKLIWFNKDNKEYTPDAYDCFSQVNRNFKEINMPLVLDPPKKISPQFFTEFAAEIPSENEFDNLLLHFEPSITKDTRIKIFATGFLAISTLKVKPTLYRKIGYIDNSFYTGKSIFHLYKSVFQKLPPHVFKIGIMCIPVSTISGLAGHPHNILLSFRQKECTV